MAEAFHNEALRKQRTIDRAAEAKERMERLMRKKYVNKGIQVGGGEVTTSTSKKCSKNRRHRIDKRVEEVKRDLHKQELILHDSNLVMGPVSIDEELSLRMTKT